MLGLQGYSSSSGSESEDDGATRDRRTRVAPQRPPSPPPPPPPPQPVAASREQLLASAAAAGEAEAAGGLGSVGGSLFGSLPAPKGGRGKDSRASKKDRNERKERESNKEKKSKKANKRRRSMDRASSEAGVAGGNDDDSDVEDGLVEGGEIIQASKRGRFVLGAGPAATASEQDLAVELLAEEQGPAPPPEFHAADVYAVRYDGDGSFVGDSGDAAVGFGYPGQPQPQPQPQAPWAHAETAATAGPQENSAVPAELKGRFAREFRSVAGDRLVDVDQNQLLQLSAADLAKLREEEELLDLYRQLNPDAKNLPIPGRPADANVSRRSKSKNQIVSLAAHAQTMELELIRRRQRQQKGLAMARAREGF